MSVALCCALLGVSVSWFYKLVAPRPGRRPADETREAPGRGRRGGEDRDRGSQGLARLAPPGALTYRMPGWTISEKTVADSVRRQQAGG